MANSSNFVPKNRLISAVSTGTQTTITTTEDHGFEEGQWVRLNVPGDYGMKLVYEPTKVISGSGTTLVVDYDSRALNPFITPASAPYTQAQVTAITGEWDNTASR